MFQSETKIRVRYAETDQMGYAYYGNYATYYEVARVEALRALGIPYKAMEEEGVMMPVLENFSKYIAPAKYDDELTVRVFIKELPSVKIKFSYEFYNESGQLIHTGETLLIFMKTSTRKPCKVPENMLEKLKVFFE
jgi:acyl-CoA thioester hydrolase